MSVTPQQLNQFLNQHFSLGELRTLCFELNIPYDDLEGGEARAAKTLALVQYAGRHGLFESLTAHAQAQRPNAKIGTTTPTTSTSQAEPKPAETRTEYHFHGSVFGSAIGDGSTLNAQNIAGRDININQPQSREEFAEQLKQLQALLQEAIAAKEIPDARDTVTVTEDIQDITEEIGHESPRSKRITTRLEEVAEIVDGAGKVAETAGKAGAIVLKIAPILAGLVKAAQVLF
jgi:hypothetical protein